MPQYSHKGTQKLAFVKLANSQDADAHKRPVERDWQNRRYSEDEVEAWIDAGYGVGLNIAGTKALGLLDVDQSGTVVDAVARWFGEQGALVCATPSGGYHIFLSRAAFPFSDGRYTLSTPVGSVVVEWYRGDAPRQAVLPIARTPRAALGGHVVWASRRPVGEPVSLATLLEELVDAAKVAPAGAELAFRDGDDTAETALQRVFGKRLGELTQEDVLARVRSAQQGERHNVLLRAGLVFRMRGWDLARLREAGLALFAGERTAAEEVEGVLRWVESRKVEPWSEVAQANARRRLASFPDLIAAAFPEGVEWYAEGDETYVLHAGQAVRGVDGLAAYFSAQDIPLATERAKRLLLYIRHNYPLRAAVHILRDYPALYPFGFALGVRVEGRVLALVAGGGELALRDPRMLGVFVEWGREYRMMERSDLDAAQRLGGELLGMLGSFFVRSDTPVADVALLLAATAMAKSIVFITGESGSGKTTLSLLLQHVLNGRPATLSTRDVRDFNAVASRSRLVGFEEVEGLEKDFWDKIKIFTTFGELSQRALFTNKDLATVASQASFVFATTDIGTMPGDVLRRAVHFSPSIFRRPFLEDVFVERLKAEGSRYVVGLLWLLRNWQPQAYAGSLYDMLVGGAKPPELPEWLAKANKADLTHAYYYMYRELGVLEEQARRAWERSRQGMAAKALGLWGDVLAKADEDAGFAEKMRQGATAAEIAAALGKEGREIGRKLHRDALKIAPALAEMGWVVRVEEGKNRYRAKAKVYILVKDEQKASEDPPF